MPKVGIFSVFQHFDISPSRRYRSIESLNLVEKPICIDRIGEHGERLNVRFHGDNAVV